MSKVPSKILTKLRIFTDYQANNLFKKMNEEMNRDRHFSFCADRGRAKIIISVIDHTTTLAFDK